MKVTFRENDLDRLEVDKDDGGKYSKDIANAYRKRMQSVRAAEDERDLRAVRSHHFEKLQGARSDQYSIRLNDQWRLVFELIGEGADKTVHILSIEDYH